MVQTCMKEKIAAREQEMTAVRKEVSKIHAIEEKPMMISEQTEKMHQMLITLMESIAEERTVMGEGKAETSVREMNSMKAKQKEGSFSKEYENETKTKKNEGEYRNNERNKFKKVEMSMFNDKDPNSWLFLAGRYFQIHKLSDAKKVLVATVSFEGPTLNWH